LPGMVCPWKEDYQDAKRVAVQLGIDFKLYDFETQYRHKVVEYMVAEYQAGRTPNPDIMCNQEVKFKLFLDTALTDGADMIATGHYARVGQEPAAPGKGVSRMEKGEARAAAPPYSLLPTPYSAALYAAVDQNKDQSYFLYRVTEQALRRSLMPIGEYRKPEVRQLAKKMGLVTAAKKDSQGICFVGKVGIKEFLSQYVTTAPGAIVDQHGTELGQHEGALFYTIGQRHGLNIGGGLPYYVIEKDMETNTVVVSTDLDDDRLWRRSFALCDVHWINGQPVNMPHRLQIRTRYRAPLVDGSVRILDDGGTQITLQEPVRAITPGQSAVFYDGDQVLGGGIVRLLVDEHQ